jgi:hypothetical protein
VDVTTTEYPLQIKGHTIEDLQLKIRHRDETITKLIDESIANRDLIRDMNKRVVYLTTLLLSINESQTTKTQWEELLMVLKLTVPDRHELNSKLNDKSPQEILMFLDEEDLK